MLLGLSRDSGPNLGFKKLEKSLLPFLKKLAEFDRHQCSKSGLFNVFYKKSDKSLHCFIDIAQAYDCHNILIINVVCSDCHLYYLQELKITSPEIFYREWLLSSQISITYEVQVDKHTLPSQVTTITFKNLMIKYNKEINKHVNTSNIFFNWLQVIYVHYK